MQTSHAGANGGERTENPSMELITVDVADLLVMARHNRLQRDELLRASITFTRVARALHDSVLLVGDWLWDGNGL